MPAGDVPRVAAAILAGGRARRLHGADKARLLVGGVRILDRQIALLRPIAAHLFIVANEPERYSGFGVPLIADVLPDRGALGGIYSALCAAAGARTLVVACDLPFLTREFLERLIGWAPGADVTVPCESGRRHPLCAIWAARTADALRARIDAGQLKVGDAMDALHAAEMPEHEVARFDPDGRLLLNVNTPDDYREACERP